MEALYLMKDGNAAGPRRVLVDLMIVCEKCLKLLTKVTNDMLDGKKMPKSLRKTGLLPIYKGKGDVKSCGNYRSIKLLGHGMKVIERVLRKVV